VPDKHIEPPARGASQLLGGHGAASGKQPRPRVYKTRQNHASTEFQFFGIASLRQILDATRSANLRYQAVAYQQSALRNDSQVGLGLSLPRRRPAANGHDLARSAY
jgi:hypothetical protein